MALIQCSECGRTISDRASVCVGCGAPLTARSAWGRTGFNPEPEPSRTAPPGRSQLLYRGSASLLALVLGLIGANQFDHRVGAGHVIATLAALLVVLGLCGLIVTAIQLLMLRR